MGATFELDRYLRRIGYAGSADATLETLTALHRLHPSAIPFENLDPLLRRPVRLDVESLQRKLVDEGRGGYCFEHNLLFAEALGALGFTVRGLAARVLWNAPDAGVRPRSHMLLQVDVDGRRYVADVGFGGLTLTGPLRLESGLEQQTPHERFRLMESGATFVMEAAIAGAWKPLYSFTLEEHLLADYEVANWYTSTHPESRFVSSLMAARVVDRTRHALLNDQLSTYHGDGSIERRTLTDGAQIASALREVMGIALPDAPELEAVLNRLVAASVA